MDQFPEDPQFEQYLVKKLSSECKNLRSQNDQLWQFIASHGLLQEATDEGLSVPTGLQNLVSSQLVVSSVKEHDPFSDAYHMTAAEEEQLAQAAVAEAMTEKDISSERISTTLKMADSSQSPKLPSSPHVVHSPKLYSPRLTLSRSDNEAQVTYLSNSVSHSPRSQHSTLLVNPQQQVSSAPPPPVSPSPAQKRQIQQNTFPIEHSFDASAIYDAAASDALLLESLLSIRVQIVSVSSIRRQDGQPDYVGAMQKETSIVLLAVYREYEFLWYCEKSYGDFVQLESQLKREQGNIFLQKLKKLPDKSLVGQNVPAKRDQLKTELDVYFAHLMSSLPSSSLAVQTFLSTGIVNVNAPTVRVLSDGTAEKEGILFKKGKNFGAWKSRYFVLKNTALEYYDSKNGHRLGQIRLENAQVARQKSDSADGEYRHAFLIIEALSNTRHILCAETDDDRDEWVYVLCQNIRSNTASSLPLNDASSTSALETSLHQVMESLDASNPKLSLLHIEEPVSLPLEARSTSETTNVASPQVVSVENGKKSKFNFFRSNKSSNRETNVINTSSDSLPSVSYNSDRRPSVDDGALVGSAASGESPLNESIKAEKKRGNFLQKAFKRDVSTTSIDQAQPSRRMFGVSLLDAVNVSAIGRETLLPSVAYRCIEYLEAKNAATEEGLYRLSGSTAVIKTIRDRFDEDGDYDLLGSGEYFDVHAVSGVFKLYLREMPECILTNHLVGDFAHALESASRDERISKLNILLHSMPRPHFVLLKRLIRHLLTIVELSNVNKMTLRNIGIVFSATLGMPAGVFVLLMTEFSSVFGEALTQST